MTTKPVNKLFFVKELPANQEIDVSKLKRLTKAQANKLLNKAMAKKKS
jgi:hypothetical protein